MGFRFFRRTRRVWWVCSAYCPRNTGSLRFRKDCVYSALGVNAAIDLNIALPFDKDKQRRADRVALDEIPIELYGSVFVQAAIDRDLLIESIAVCI